jgi:hypothetical protein
MPLTLHPTGLSSPAYRDWLDYVIVEDGRDVGRLYEDRHSGPELRWFWAISIYVNPRLGITTSGRAASVDEAKAQFLAALGDGSSLLDVLCRLAGRICNLPAGRRGQPCVASGDQRP